MEKFSRILLALFFLLILNICLNFYILNKIAKINKERPSQIVQKIESSPFPSTKPVEATNSADIKADLNIIKVELRSIRESLTTNGLLSPNPNP